MVSHPVQSFGIVLLFRNTVSNLVQSFGIVLLFRNTVSNPVKLQNCSVFLEYGQSPSAKLRNCSAGLKIHAGTRHYAVLPLSFAVMPLKCAESARHDLLPCPDCQNLVSVEIGGKVHVKLTTNHNIYFHFYMHDAFGAVPPKMAASVATW